MEEEGHGRRPEQSEVAKYVIQYVSTFASMNQHLGGLLNQRICIFLYLPKGIADLGMETNWSFNMVHDIWLERWTTLL